MMGDSAPAIFCEETPYLMRVGAVRKTDDPKVSYVRTYEWVAPFYALISRRGRTSRSCSKPGCRWTT